MNSSTFKVKIQGRSTYLAIAILQIKFHEKYWDLVKFVMCTLVSRDRVPFLLVYKTSCVLRIRGYT